MRLKKQYQSKSVSEKKITGIPQESEKNRDPSFLIIIFSDPIQLNFDFFLNRKVTFRVLIQLYEIRKTDNVLQYWNSKE